MSKIGKKSIPIPQGVEVSHKNSLILVKGPKGELSLSFDASLPLKYTQSDDEISLSLLDEEQRNMRGLYRSLIANMITGVTTGYEKKLKVVGVGFDAQVKGKKLVLKVGFSHPVEFPLPEGVEVSAEKDKKDIPIITLSSIDKQLIGQVAHKIRAIRPPEPYKGKGIRYFDEVVQMKEGKTAGKE